MHLRAFLLLFFFAVLPLAAHALTVEEISELAGLTMRADPNLAQAERIVNARGGRLALYGGNSRELVDFVTRKCDELGGAAAYKAWLAKQPMFSTLEWHRVMSDMDLMILPGALGTPKEELQKAGEEVKRFFPTGVFFKTLDFNVSTDFFAKYDPLSENLEPISNMLISGRGLEDVPQLHISRGGKDLSLSYLGAEQYAKKELDFEILRGPDGKIKGDTYGKIRQMLRYFRFVSEYPDFKKTYRVTSSINQLMEDILGTDTETHKLLKEAVTAHRGEGLAGKVADALLKAQIYTRDPIALHRRFHTYAIDHLLEDAGAQSLKLTPLMPRTEKVPEGAERLGKAVKVYHRTSLGAAQNMSNGALFISDEATILDGKRMAAAYGKGIYASTRTGSLSYGDYYVEITLSPDAIKGVDYELHGDYYVIKTLDAIQKTKDGKLAIPPITREGLLRNFLTVLENPEGAADEEKNSIYQALGKVLAPELGGEDERVFFALLERAKTDKPGYRFLSSYLEKPGVAEMLNHPAAAALKQRIRQAIVDLPGGATSDVLALFPELGPTLAARDLEQIAVIPSALRAYMPYIQQNAALAPRLRHIVEQHPEIAPTAELMKVVPKITVSPDYVKHLLEEEPFIDRYILWFRDDPENTATLSAAFKGKTLKDFKYMYSVKDFVEKIPALHADFARAIMDTEGELEIAKYPKFFPLPPDLDERLKTFLKANPAAKMNYGQLGTLLDNGYVPEDPYFVSKDFFQEGHPMVVDARKKFLTFASYRERLARLPADAIPERARLELFLAAPKEFSHLIDDKTIASIIGFPARYESEMNSLTWLGSIDPKFAERLLKICEARPKDYVPYQFRQSIPQFAVKDVLDSMSDVYSIRTATYLADNPGRFNFTRHGPYSPLQYVLALRQGTDLDLEKRYALAFAAYLRGSREPDVKKLFFEFLQNPEAEWDGDRFPSWITGRDWKPSVDSLNDMFEIMERYPFKDKEKATNIFSYLAMGGFGTRKSFTTEDIAKALVDYLDRKGGSLTAEERRLALALAEKQHNLYAKDGITAWESVIQRIQGIQVSPGAVCPVEFAKVK
jgi:hypothetical protein